MGRYLLVLGFLLLCQPLGVFVAYADQQLIPAQQQPPRYLSRIEVHTVEELGQLLVRAEQLFNNGSFREGVDTPVAFVLHGAEAKSLLRDHYQIHKPLVDLAARLSAFQVVDIKVCRTWLGGEKLDESQLPPFVGTVAYGPAEVERLMEEENYVYF